MGYFCYLPNNIYEKEVIIIPCCWFEVVRTSQSFFQSEVLEYESGSWKQKKMTEKVFSVLLRFKGHLKDYIRQIKIEKKLEKL